MRLLTEEDNKGSKPMTGDQTVVDDVEYEVGYAKDVIELMANKGLCLTNTLPNLSSDE